MDFRLLRIIHELFYYYLTMAPITGVEWLDDDDDE
jgi:hypothetical protein